MERAVCDDLGNGYTSDRLVQDIVNNSDYTPDDATTILDTAQRVYCP